MFRRVISKAPIATVGARYAASVNQDSVAQALTKRGKFTPEHIKECVAQFAELGFDPSYFTSFNEQAIQEHAYGFLCARADEAQSKHFQHDMINDKSAFFYCDGTPAQQATTMRKIEDFVTKHKDLMKTSAVSVRNFTGKGVSLYTVNIDAFRNATPAEAIKKAKGPKLEDVSTDKFLKDLAPETKELYQGLLTRVHSSFKPVFELKPAGDETAMTIAFKADRLYFQVLMSVLNEIPNVTVSKQCVETFSNGVHVYQLCVKGANAKQLAEKAYVAGLMPTRGDDSPVEKLFCNGVITAEESLFFDALINFAFYFTPAAKSEDFTRLSSMVEKETVGLTRLKSFRATMKQEIVNSNHLAEVLCENIDISKKIFEDFAKGTNEEARKKLIATIEDRFDRDIQTCTIMKAFVSFNEAAVLHNFFKPEKAALCFRLAPQVFMPKLDFPRVPYGMFMFIAPGWRGFHIRFTDIARGGVRMIISDSRSYRNNKLSVLQENYNLALTQLMKNKDIPEGGSKGTILIEKSRLENLDEQDRLSYFLQYVDSMCDLMVANQEGVVDHLKKPEVIFLGPDENTAGHYPVIAALHSKERGFKYWKAFTTGKEPSLGGIPHDIYGMTTRSVRMNVEGVYRKLGLKQETTTKFVTGGPDGDLGSNEVIRGNEPIRGMVDGSGVLFDPAGINRDELLRLCKLRVPVSHFDTSKLSKGGFLVKADKNHDADPNAKPIVLPDGTQVKKTVEFRDTFHFNKLLAGVDTFVTGGGRPKSITLENVHKLLLNHPAATGEAMLKGLITDVKPEDLMFKYIIEGANLFITDDARIALERVGVCLIKDACANKGGVTSSSLEVYTSLVLTPEEHDKLMCFEGDKLTDFYKAIVDDICEFVESKATREFELVWKTQLEHPELTKTEIIDMLSRKIVAIRSFMHDSNLFEDKKLMKYVLEQHTPKTLKKAVPMDELMKRVPENYQEAITAMWCASNYVYDYGLESNEFDFYEFMSGLKAKAQS